LAAAESAAGFPAVLLCFISLLNDYGSALCKALSSFTDTAVHVMVVALQALTSLASTLKELKMNGAASLSSRSLLILSVLGQLEALELTHCGKISWV